MSEFHLVLSSCPNRAHAQTIAKALVVEKLAACVQISAPICSVYHWQGEICEDNEVQVIIKTTGDKLDEAYKRTLSLHPYDVPQWLVLNVGQGSREYLDWIKSSLK